MKRQFGLRAQLVTAGVVVLAVVTIVTLVLLNSAERRLEEQAFDQLRSVRVTKAANIESEVNDFIGNLEVVSTSRAATQSLSELSSAFSDLGEPLDQAALDDYYETEFAPRVQGSTYGVGLKTSYQPKTDSGKRLQDLYIANNPNQVGSKDDLIDPKDGSDYSRIHAEIHPFFRAAQQSFGAYDIFLIDNDGNVVYSVFKEIDVGTNLDKGPLRLSGLADAWRESVQTARLSVTDFEPYLPSYNAPAAFTAEGVYDDGGNRIGTVAMQLPVDRINDVMTSNQEWAETGLGESGETYIVADNLTMRNDSRFLIEDKAGFIDAITDAGVKPTSIELIEAFNSTIGLLAVDTQGTQAALAGETGAAVFPDYRGVDVLSDYGPLDIRGLDWVVMSEIDAAEAFKASNDMQRVSLTVLGITGVVMLGAIVFIAGRIVRPIRTVEGETMIVADLSFAAGDHYDTAVLDRIGTRRDEIGDLATAFSSLVSSLEENVGARVAVEGELNVAADIQRALLPLTFPTPPDVFEFKLHAMLVPAKEVGGDFYDFGEIDEHHWFFLVGDVSGKGVPAALFMAASKTLIRSGAMSGEALDTLMTRINAEIQEGNTEFMFATVWIGVLDLRTGHVVFVNAGHNPPLIHRADGTKEYIHETHVPFIGPVPGIEYTTGELRLAPGDRITVYSDGVTEAMDPDEELYGEDQLENLDLPVGALDATKTIVDSVLTWEQGTRSDDVTVLVLDFIRKREDLVRVIPVPTIDPFQAVTDLNAEVEVFAVESSLPAEVLARVQTVLDEVITNVLNHGEADTVTVEMSLAPKLLTVTVTDNGHEFNPLNAPVPDTTLSLEEREIGGLGIHLVRNMMDAVTYAHHDGFNELTLTLEVPDR